MKLNNKIILLDESVYNKIAAGEVVGRPASVVKELMENSIDAGAKNISVVIKDAGKQLIQVTDDGEGMSEADVLLSVKRHATSKIRNSEDLEHIGTFGFRGEALSSVAAVSNLTIKTNDGSEELGTTVSFDENGKIEIDKSALPQGTTVIVKNLFYNVPARKHFLKSNQTEFKKIVETFNNIALAYPEITFQLFKENKLFVKYMSGGLRERMKEIFGETILDLTIEFAENAEEIAAFGFVAKPTYLTNSKGNQFLFVNGRHVKNKTVSNSVFAAYENILAKGEYPFFVLFLTINTDLVDVNVHPAKEEIKFYDDSQIYAFVKSVVKKALGGYDFIPEVNLKDEKIEQKLELIVSKGRKSNKIYDENYTFSGGAATSDDELDLLFGKIDDELQNKNSGASGAHPFAKKTDEKNAGDKTAQKKQAGDTIFYLHEKYIVTQIKSGMMLIDANRAQRRILYEKALTALKKGVPFSQQLLFAQTFRLSQEEYEVLQKFDSEFSRLGFEIKYHAKDTISIIGVPSDIKLGSETKTLLGIINALRKYGEGNVDKIIAETYAELLAVKEGESLSENEMRLIIDQLFATSDPLRTPQGKKIFAKISLEKISEFFKD